MPGIPLAVPGIPLAVPGILLAVPGIPLQVPGIPLAVHEDSFNTFSSHDLFIFPFGYEDFQIVSYIYNPPEVKKKLMV